MASKTAFNTKRDNLWMFDPAELVLITDPTHPLYDERVLLPIEEPLVRSIMHKGVVAPVVVAKADGGEQPVVIDGRQRVKAAREANQRLAEQGLMPIRVPCALRRGEETAGLFGVMVLANELRQDDSVLNRARKAGRMLQMGASEDEVALSFGKSTSTINQWLKLLECAAEVICAVESGQISAAAAIELSRLPHAEQLTALQQLLAASTSSPQPTNGTGDLPPELPPQARKDGGRNGKPVSARAAKRAVAEANGEEPPAEAGPMRSRAEVEARLKAVDAGLDKNLGSETLLGWFDALQWVLKVEGALHG